MFPTSPPSPFQQPVQPAPPPPKEKRIRFRTAVTALLAAAAVGATTAAIGLFVWTVIVGLLDNVLRPILIRRGADLPLLLIMAGVIGGLLGFGLVGLFVGPVVLAVAYTQLTAWIDEQDATPDPGAAPPADTESPVTVE